MVITRNQEHKQIKSNVVAGAVKKRIRLNSLKSVLITN